MPPPGTARQYKLFISHAWDYGGEYESVVNLLNADARFRWENLSVPEEQPIFASLLFPKSYRYMVRQLDERIRRSDCLLVIGGMYVAHRGWIQSEIEAAQEFGKPIIAIRPRGSERMPTVLSGATEEVGWMTDSIIAAIRRQAGGPPTTLAGLAGGLL